MPRFRRERVEKEPLTERMQEAIEPLTERVQEAVEPLAERVRERAEPLTERVREATADALADSLPRAREAAQEGRQRLRKATAELDVPWARSWLAQWIRENFMRFVLTPIIDYYASRRAVGYEKVAGLDEPVILIANHTSHMDTPIILAALPRRLRKHTTVAAAADYFYRNRWTAILASLLFNTVPVDRKGGGVGTRGGKGTGHLDKLLDQGWSLLLYPEGSRWNKGERRVRRGAAVLASEHHMPVVPIRVEGTAEAMPPGQIWPRRLHRGLFARRHRIRVAFGDPIQPQETATMIELVQAFFDSGRAGPASASPYRRRGSSSDE